MPCRKIPIVTGEIYHVFNRSVAHTQIFTTHHDYARAVELIRYYRYGIVPMRYSHFKRLTQECKDAVMDSLIKRAPPVIDIIAYCIMPTHVHFLLKQKTEGGISMFMRNFQHSYSKYFNTKYTRYGSLYQSMFKVVRIESDAQLLHVSRYIHLNPVTAYLLNINNIHTHVWSSYIEYVQGSEPNSFISSSPILDHFSSKMQYKDFVYDQADYQRQLSYIKHFIYE